MKKVSSIRPQDVAILVKLLAHPKRDWMQSELAHLLGLSQGEIAKAIARLKMAGLLANNKPIKAAAREFLIHAVKYTFPIEVGPLAVGLPTSISAPMHKDVVLAPEGVEGIYVWPYSKGEQRGQSIKPLYPALPEAALQDEKFYGLMAALDMLRIGRAREKKAAQAYIEKEIKK